MHRAHNFSAGPSPLPLAVLEEVQQELLDYQGMGASLLEVSHRGPQYTEVEHSLRERLRDLLGLPAGWHILLLQGGASLQFYQVALNFLHGGRVAGYLNTGHWARGAMQEAARVGAVYEVASSEASAYDHLPAADTYRVDPGTSWIHFTSNNTIYGTQFAVEPDVDRSIPLVCDASSDFLGRPIDLGRYGLIYAEAQKNLGPSGVTIVLVREDFLSQSALGLPTMLSYRTHVGTLFNTPPVFVTWIVEKVLAHVQRNGGLAAQFERNQQKARALYAEIDRTGFWRGTVRERDRSLMNVTFRAPSPELDKLFVAASEQADIIGLAGYRTVGGMRASLYNAVELSSVRTLVECMREFERTHG